MTEETEELPEEPEPETEPVPETEPETEAPPETEPVPETEKPPETQAPAETQPQQSASLKRGDCNGDGKITILDMMLINKQILGFLQHLLVKKVFKI